MNFREQEHDNYAQDLLRSLSDENPEAEPLEFKPNLTQSRNAAKAMTAILCHRLFNKSSRRPLHKSGTTHEWKDGIFNCRNITDRSYLWTNIRRDVANKVHDIANRKAVAYLMACSNPSDEKLVVWAIPEPVLYASLSNLPLKEGGTEYTIQIQTNKQRIEHDAASPDLTKYFREFPLSRQELLVLQQSRTLDDSVRSERKNGREQEETEDSDGDSTEESDTRKLLAPIANEMNEAGNFDPEGIIDARHRVLSSIVRRQGQPAFRQQLIVAYKGQCAISGCKVEAVLEAAHIFPYKGPDTNHPANGLLLRSDLHTLFDLKLVTIDVATMTLIISPVLIGTCYEEYLGIPITLPDDRESRPSREAINQHRQESGL